MMFHNSLLADMSLLLFCKQTLCQGENYGGKYKSTKLAEKVELSCFSPSPWFFCVWEGPRRDRVCALRSEIGKEEKAMCGGVDMMEIQGEIPILIILFNFVLKF